MCRLILSSKGVHRLLAVKVFDLKSHCRCLVVKLLEESCQLPQQLSLLQKGSSGEQKQV